MLKGDFQTHAKRHGYPISWENPEVKKYHPKGDLIKTLFAHVKNKNDVIALVCDNAEESAKSISLVNELKREQRYREFEKLTIYPAEEAITLDGEVLFIFPRDSKPEMIGPSKCHLAEPMFMEKVDRTRREGAVVALPHPFYKIEAPIKEKTPQGVGTVIFNGNLNENLEVKKDYEEFFNRVDAVEVYNATALLPYFVPILRNSWIRAAEKARAVCKKYNKAMLGNSDNHNPRMVGIAYTELESYDAIKEIKLRRTRPVFSLTRFLDPTLYAYQFVYHLNSGGVPELLHSIMHHTLGS